MNKKERIYIIVLVSSVVLYVIFQVMKPKPVDWNPSFTGLDKVPYGCYILRDQLPTLFPGQEVIPRTEPIYTSYNDTSDTKNYIFINNSFSPDRLETEKLIERVSQGNRAFISALYMEGALPDTLGFTVAQALNLRFDQTTLSEDSLGLNFTNPRIRRDRPWYYPEENIRVYFSSLDTVNTVVLGTNDKEEVNFIQIPFGEGAFFIHVNPLVFTNYYLLKPGKAGYAFRALSYLPEQPTVWDEYYKVGRSYIRTPVRYIVSQVDLKWAWFTTLVTILLFMVFRAKRNQRIIPIHRPPKNTSLEFVKTVGRLYHQHGNHKDLAEKKILYFREYLQSRLRLQIKPPDRDFIRHVAARSGLDRAFVSDLFNTINSMQQKEEITLQQLQKLNNKIDHFYQHSLR
ncbi:MAG: DUF4350 domain-containing protein [Balneolaceae bacterium]|nr:DUF4350 domain-containing protein [Balneolaceae bacterium]